MKTILLILILSTCIFGAAGDTLITVFDITPIRTKGDTALYWFVDCVSGTDTTSKRMGYDELWSFLNDSVGVVIADSGFAETSEIPGLITSNSIVVSNAAHRNGDGSDHADVATNTLIAGSVAAGTSGQVPYSDGANGVDYGNNLKIDQTTGRVTIVEGTDTSPNAALDIGGNINFESLPKMTAGELAGIVATASGSGNSLDAGTYYYNILYCGQDGCAEGYNSSGSQPNVVVSSGELVTLTNIPISSDPRVTSRKIYRTSAGGSYYLNYYLDTISDNTTTAYIDDGSNALDTDDLIYNKSATGAGMLTVDGTTVFSANKFDAAVGMLWGATLKNSVVAAVLASNATMKITDSFIAGYYPLYLCTDIDVLGSVVIGDNAARGADRVDYDIYLGAEVARNLGGYYNTIVGNGSGKLSSLQTGIHELWILGAQNGNDIVGSMDKIGLLGYNVEPFLYGIDNQFNIQNTIMARDADQEGGGTADADVDVGIGALPVDGVTLTVGGELNWDTEGDLAQADAGLGLEIESDTLNIKNTFAVALNTNLQNIVDAIDDTATAFIDTTDLFTTTLLNNAAANTASKTYTYTRIPMLVADNDTIIAGCSAALGADDDDDHDFAMRYSTDGGASWSAISFPWGQADSLNMLHTFPLLRDDNRVFFFAQTYDVSLTHYSVRYAYTDDWGQTIYTAGGGAVTNYEDMANLDSLVSGDRFIPENLGFEIKNGANRGRLVIACGGYEDTSHPAGTVERCPFVLYSDDDGVVWEVGNPVPAITYEFDGITAGLDEPSLYERQDGSLVMLMRGVNSTLKTKYVSYSTDGGETWTYPVPDYEVQQGSLVMCPSTVLSGLAGDIPRLVVSHPKTTGYRDLELMLSYDQGESYQYKKTVWTDYIRYSQVAGLSDLDVGVLFEGGLTGTKEKIVFIKTNVTTIRQ